MRPNAPTTVHHAGNVQQDIKLGLDPRATAHLIGILTDLYSNPVAAVMREYSTNALDSHITAGQTRPVAVHLPTQSAPFFSVQDWGVGLSIDNLVDIFSQYGASDKRESDDVAGMLGLGCKSALTYTDTFNIVAVKAGVQVTAVVVKDTDGVGLIRVLDTRAVDLPNGVTITIPVRPSDISRFEEAATQLFRFWPKGSVAWDANKAIPFIWDWTAGIWLDDDVWVGAGASDVSYVVQANVAYPVENPYRIAGLNFVAFVPTGSVNFTPSREALHYTAITKDTLRTLGEYIRETLPAKIEELFAATASPWERLTILNQWRQASPQAVKNWQGQWGPRPAIPTDTVAWRWEGGVQARKLDQAPSWLSLLESPYYNSTRLRHVILGYPHKTITATARVRLGQVGISHAYVLPVGTTNTAALDGHPGLWHWADIVAQTTVEREKREPKAKTKYVVWHQGSTRYWTAEEIPDDAPLLWFNENDSKVTPRGTEVYTEAYIVSLKTGQIDKFQRLFPWAAPLSEYHRVRVHEAERALTKADRVSGGVTRNWWGFKLAAAGLVDKIDDPELAFVIGHISAATSPTLERYCRLIARSRLDAAPEIEAVDAAYPLVSEKYYYGYGDNDNDALDILIYVNAKYAAVSA